MSFVDTSSTLPSSSDGCIPTRSEAKNLLLIAIVCIGEKTSINDFILNFSDFTGLSVEESQSVFEVLALHDYILVLHNNIVILAPKGLIIYEKFLNIALTIKNATSFSSSTSN